MKPALVVLGWACLNAALMFVMFFYGENPLFIGLYAAAALLAAVAAAIVWLVHRAPRTSLPFRLPANSVSAGLLGVAGILVGLGFLYGHWLTIIAGWFALAALVHVPRERLPAGVVPGPTAVPTDPAVHERRGVLPKAAKAATAAGFLAKATGSLWRKRGRERRS